MDIVSTFPLGELKMSGGVELLIPPDEILVALSRHAQQDWGLVTPENREANNEALLERKRILSVYISNADVVFWILTEGDRSVTVALLPEEYA